MKKIIFGLMLILGIYLCGSQTAFASESMNDTFKVDGVTFEYSDSIQSYLDLGYEPIILVNRNFESGVLSTIRVGVVEDGCVLGAYFTQNTYLEDGKGYYRIKKYDSGGAVLSGFLNQRLFYDSSNGTYYWEGGGVSNYGFSVYNYVYDNCVYELVYSPSDVYLANADNVLDFDTIFFHRMPVPMKSFPKIAKKAGLARVMNQVVRILPIVMAVSVGYLGLRKALTILRKVLFQA